MRTFIIVATSSDGFVANDEHVNSFTWTSPEDKKAFIKMTKDAKVVIVGSKTFKTFGKPGESPKPLKDRLNIVYSRTAKHSGANLETTAAAPAELIMDLAGRGHQDAAIIGGAEIYRMFLDAGQVQKVYMTVEPVTFGSGIPFWTPEQAKKFKLVNEHKLDTGTRFLTYELKPRVQK